MVLKNARYFKENVIPISCLSISVLILPQCVHKNIIIKSALIRKCVIACIAYAFRMFPK